MYRFLSFVAWYYLLVIFLWAFSAIKDKRDGNQVNFEEINLDFFIISVIYLIYYYIGGFE